MNKILIVDPSVTFANFISFALIRSGYRIVHATDAEKAREILSLETFDLLIFETRLPGMDGFEFCKTIKMQPGLSNIPLVIISIDGTPESRQYAREIGCCDYLTKPLSLHSLHEVMQRHLPFISKRRFQRAQIQIAASVTLGSRKSTMYSSCLGERGLYLESAAPYPVGTLLEIILFLPGLENSPLNLKGEVMYAIKIRQHHLPPGMGIKFIDLSRDNAAQLTNYIESYLSGFLPVTPSTPDNGAKIDLR